MRFTLKEVYLDHAATTPLRKEVLEAMMPIYQEHFGNPSSIHRFGRRARQAVDEARVTLAKTINAHPNELIFTSGGTEADNLAILGFVANHQHRGHHLITTQIEHHAILDTFKHLEQRGFDVTYLPVDESGRIAIESLREALRDDTILVSIMYGNNETGALQPIDEIGQLLADKNITFHTDAVQAFGSVPIDVLASRIDMMSTSAHKINGPKGIGFLYVKKELILEPQSFGGEQERKRRSGTENVAGIVGFAKAAELAILEMEQKVAIYTRLKEQLLAGFEKEQIAHSVNGDIERSLPHLLNVSFHGKKVDSLLVNLDLAGIAVSSGSACTAGTLQPSHVLKAMFDDEERVRSAIRFSLGLGNDENDIDYVVCELAKIVKR